ncbi:MULTISPECIES: copper amine oxidase [Paenibacillus]|uniref:Copper amine oxidase n=1 Tax=Paenibacillus agri TaxID=2744309 RepID=A0A850EWZ9_9BACL|nr:copper amine oxidase [Paenibacillus agri]NUU64169.1 copper amine oxidase [Paenibacillus agri]
MRWKKIALCVLVFSLMGGSLLFADSVSQKIKVWSNGKEITDGGYLIDGKTYIPAREAGGVVIWDGSGKVTILKPNVHIVLFKGDTVFGNVNLGKLKFKVLSQVDSLTDEISSVKVTITDPSGNSKDIDSRNMEGTKKEDFWFSSSEITYDFKEAGKYRVGFYIRPTKNGDYVLVSEKVITALN